MTDEFGAGKENKPKGGRVEATEVNGKTLTAEEILARAQVRLQARQAQKQQQQATQSVAQPKPPRQNGVAPTLAQKVQETARQEQKVHADVAETLANQQATPVQEPPIAEAPVMPSNSQATLVKGSAWLSAGGIISRVLGALYVIPWMALLGMYANRSNALFGQGYNIYAIFLMIATAGIPTAISKLVAQYNAMQEGRLTRQLLRQSSWLGLFMGLASGAAIYFGAPILSGGNDKLIPVLQSLAPAVALFPILSIWRGYFQGHQLMDVSALSQIIEQIARVAYMLIATVIILNIDNTNWTGVVVHSTFAAFVGALFSMGVLVWGWLKYDRFFTHHLRQAQNKVRVSTRKLLGGILKEAWPFIIIGSAINLFQLVDQYTFFSVMQHFFTYSQTSLENQFALMSANPNKIIMIIVPFATAIAATALPMLSESRVNLAAEEIQEQLRQMFKLFAVIMLPSALGMFAIAKPLYIMFYNRLDPLATQQGVYLLQYSSLMALFFGLFMLLAFALQGLSQVRIVMRAFGIGLLVKTLVQIPMIFYFEMMGPLVASVLGMAIAIAYMLDYLSGVYEVSMFDVMPDITKMFGGALVMVAVAMLLANGLDWLLPKHQFFSAINAIFSAGVGGIIIAALYLRMGYGQELLGHRLKRLPAWLTGQKKVSS